MINTIIGIVDDPAASVPNKMLGLRCICNLFVNSAAIFVLRKRRNKIVEIVSKNLTHEKDNVRESAITALLNYSINFLIDDDEEGKI